MSSVPSAAPPSVRILELVTSAWKAQAVSTVAALGVADALAAGPLPTEKIAARVGAHEDGLYRLLRACAELGLFEERPERAFALTDLGEALVTEGEQSMRHFAMWVGTDAERGAWSELEHSVRSGEPAFPKVFGHSVWSRLENDPALADVFDRAMTELSRRIISAVVDVYDFTPFSRIVDVGGGRGALLAAVLAAAPEARGVLFDRPEVIGGAGEPLRAAGVADRCELVSGDFFDSVPSGGDAYLISNILHDWDDAASVRLLGNCRSAMAADGRVLLVEAVMPDPGTPRSVVTLMDLDMFAVCGGRQRTVAEFEALFARSGLRLARVVPGGHCSIVEAVRA